MAKTCEEWFPLGSYPRQQSDGFYISEFCKDNIDVFAEKITSDMQFVLLVSGDGTVGNGKSTVAQQMGACYTYLLNKKHGFNIPFNMNNIVFNSEQLVERAFQLPRYSCIILDEGDDLTSHYYSELRQRLNRFLRKCRQLNLFIILILPDFFEMPRPIGILYSHSLINVKFYDKFERGFYDFYGPTQKKWLYIKGKRELNYSAVKPNFSGRFVKLYAVNEDEYRQAKLQDTMDDKEDKMTKSQIEANKQRQIVRTIYKNAKGKMTNREIFTLCGISEKTFYNIIKELKDSEAPVTE